jgi:LmbE family N-acetylglucosaminyl deacetylase
MFAGLAMGGLSSLALFNLDVNDVPTPSQNIALSLHADDKAVIATSRQSTLLVSCLETSQPSLALVAAPQDSHQHLEHHRGALC